MITKELQLITSELVKKGRIPINGGIEILSNCNFRCVHCYNAMESTQYMTYEFVRELADQLEKMGTMHIYLTGGEVLLHPEFNKIYQCFRSKGIIVSVLTNASLINDELITLFGQYTPYNIDISLYGATNATYTKVTGQANCFDKVQKNIEKLSRKQIPFSLKTILLKENVHELDHMIKVADKYGKKLKIHTDIRPLNNGNQESKEHQLSIGQIVEIENKIGKWKKGEINNNQRAQEMEERKRSGYSYFCELGQYNFFITYEGMLHGCAKERRHGYDLHKMSMKEGFTYLLKDVVLRKDENINNKCKRCKFIKYCDYCPAQFELETGSILDPPEYVCRLAQKRYTIFN